MSIHSRFEGVQFVCQASDIAKENGISVRAGTCFKEYADIISAERKHQPIGRPFENNANNLGPMDGIWTIGRNEKNELVHTQAMRLIDLNGRSLSGYLADGYVEFPPPGLEIDYAKSRYNPGPSAHRINGTTCYHGDFWLSGDYRGTGLANILARFALASCHLKWAPDYIVGFMLRQVAFKGLAEREGYMHNEPSALFWHRADIDQALEAFMVWMAREDISHLLTIPLDGLVNKTVRQLHQEAA